MNVDELILLLNNFKAISNDDKFYLVILLKKNQDVDKLLSVIKQMNYASMVRTTNFGNEIVITDCIKNADS